MQEPNLDEVARRAQRYWDVDGLPELVMGLLWITWGGAWLIGDTLPRGGSASVFWIFVPALLASSGFAAVWAIKRLKARLTFPRTGYVEWKEPSRGARLTAAATAVLTAMVLVAVIGNRETRTVNLAGPLLSVILSLGFVVASLRQRAPHYLALAAVALALGVVAGASHAGWASANWMFVTLGAASAALGGIRLMLFLKKHPLAAQEG